MKKLILFLCVFFSFNLFANNNNYRVSEEVDLYYLKRYTEQVSNE